MAVGLAASSALLVRIRAGVSYLPHSSLTSPWILVCCSLIRGQREGPQ